MKGRGWRGTGGLEEGGLGDLMKGRKGGIGDLMKGGAGRLDEGAEGGGAGGLDG